MRIKGMIVMEDDLGGKPHFNKPYGMILKTIEYWHWHKRITSWVHVHAHNI